ncbi:MAG: VWA domain-containing protein [Acidobacteriota bacterium]
MKQTFTFSLLSVSILILLSLSPWPARPAAQSGRNTGSGEKSELLNVIVRAQDGEAARALNLNKDRLILFDGGIEQQIEYMRADSTGARLILLVDNTQTLRAEPTQLQKAARALINEMLPGDEMMIIAFDEQAEILQDFTENKNTLQAAVAKFRRKGLPKLYDALAATVEDAFRQQLGVNKRSIVLLSDGYDSSSGIKYENILATLLTENIVVYAFQAPDRTFGAIRPRDSGPKPVDAITGLAESTGGLIFKIDKENEIAAHAKTITNELHDGWYTLAYTPKGINPINARRLLITCPDDKLSLRTKKMHPAQIR